MTTQISVEDAEEYTQSLGQILGGSWRQIALAERMGVPDTLGLTTQEWVQQRLGGYTRLSVSERREAVRELTAPPDEGGQGMTQREAADVLGVSPFTVNRDLKPDPVRNQTPDPEAEPEAEKSEPFMQADDGFDWGEPDDDEPEADPVRNQTPDPEAEPEAEKSTRDLLAQSDENEWYTPRRFTAAAKNVLGTIDLDPASSAVANEIVGAGQFYTIHDNGLTLPWKGTVWLNPPYGGENRLFVERLIREYEAGNVSAAITLVNCHPAETQWFQKLFDYTVCFVRGRIDFTGPARDRASTSTHGSAIAYLGPDWEAFAAAFARFGAVVRRV